ncbi:hypothetical protein [Aliarcobacter vitoriensis]|uniref:Lipoprotein n=1 Tax=Aliarcobacter vitoriensis TaxID=2011099 RepID=A0A366MRS0_9BACT|nr:hypothetical protein [Aliarcobacter vitoriensis]RBQ28032.1 hypothetical protein CRU91_11470 [Aliarcobacter vitoriensis]RBQ30732.1 hypothetical protein CRU92_10320 [Arcobacter sp. FW59]
MNNIFKILLVSVVGIFVLAGCRAASVYNVVDNPVSVKTGVDDEKIYKAIKTAGSGLGWQITKVKPGLAQGQLNIRKHTAIVDIPYSSTSYSIKYKSSSALDYNAEKNTIHNNYNGWIQNLSNAIQVQLNQLQD